MLKVWVGTHDEQRTQKPQIKERTKMIVKYKMFEDSESFEKFQSENDVKIYTVTPIVGSIDMEVISNNKNTNAESKVKAFVTYSDE